MEEFSKTVSTTSWWLGVVLVGILLNIVSAYLKNPMDRFFSLISVVWRNRSAVAKTKYAARVQLLQNNAEAQRAVWEQENRANQESIIYLLLGIFLFILFSHFRQIYHDLAYSQMSPILYWFLRLTYFGSSLLIFVGLGRNVVAVSLSKLLKEARHMNAKVV